MSAQVSFIKAHLASAALKENPAEEYARQLQKIYTQSGGFDVMQVNPSPGPDEIRFIARTRRGDHWARFLMRLSKGEPGKIEIERHVKQAVAEDRFSGVVLVAKNERIIFNKAYGMAERVFSAPNRLDTKFNLGSMNKMFTSVAIAQLVQAGKLAFEDTVAKVLPEYPNKQAAERITIHHLLTHTSGLGDFFKPQFVQNREKYVNPTDYFPIFAGDPLRFEPGKGWSYSNAAFIVLGAIVEKASGQDYYDYVREHVFKPAGMKDSDSYAMDQVTANIAYGYTRLGGGDPLGIEPRRASFMSLPLKGSPAGGGYSTAPDLFNFAKALRGGKLLNAEMVERVTGSKVDTPGGMKYGYGFGNQDVNGKMVRGHGGGAPRINSDLKMFWDGSYTVIVMGNYDPPAAADLSEGITRFLSRQ